MGLWERSKLAAMRAGEAGLGLAEQAGDALGFSVALTTASQSTDAQQQVGGVSAHPAIHTTYVTFYYCYYCG